MERILCFITILAILIGTLALSGCGAKDKPADALVNGVHLSEYAIVYGEDSLDYDKRAAEYIRDEVKARTNIELAILTDAGEVRAHEIVIGDTDRPISDRLDAECEGLEFAILADGAHIALEGEYFIIAAAAYYFIDKFVPGGDSSTTVPAGIEIHEPITKKANNLILLIGDGMGLNHTKIFDYREDELEYSDGEDVFYGELLPYHGYSRTASLSGVTDSAAGGTALSAGYKTYNEFIGRDKDGNDVKLITELASELGKASAVMSTESNTGATPSTFSAHVDNRDSSGAISQSQLATMQKYGTVIDCGYDYYNKRMINNSVEKHITDTLAKIGADPDGFFLMYEEAHIDKHSHNNDIDKLYQAVVRFNQAIGRIMEYAFYHPDTMVLITADHETGDLRDVDGVLTYHSEEHTLTDVPVFAWGEGGELFDGQTVENIQIAHTLASLMGVYDFGDQSEFSYLKGEANGN